MYIYIYYMIYLYIYIISGIYKLYIYIMSGIYKLYIIYTHFHNILRLLMFYQIFLSTQVKRSAIITYKHGIYELPYKLPNYLRLRILGN